MSLTSNKRRANGVYRSREAPLSLPLNWDSSPSDLTSHLFLSIQSATFPTLLAECLPSNERTLHFISVINIIHDSQVPDVSILPEPPQVVSKLSEPSYPSRLAPLPAVTLTCRVLRFDGSWAQTTSGLSMSA